ncbi:hypothetical protein GJ688_18020 [Heliobacillus mobilis]|uniref:Uncharacterized protein n=1 Tax=Heliobacterium mobile TaxID=28064 RepID=A0A6I3SP76_HELMO|nr:hypothetical protein [Heliobacterium mobile]MTV50831.1 hypothetical protein [Heliobacterium mobile]
MDTIYIPDSWNFVKVASMVRQLQNCDKHPSYPINLLLDFSNVKSLRCHHIVPLIAYVKLQRHNGRTVEIQCINMNPEVASYASRIGFFRQLQIPYKENRIFRDSSGKFIEVKDVPKECAEQLGVELNTIFKHQLNDVFGPLRESFGYAVGEILDNVTRHSKTPIDGIIAAQNYKDKVECCLADCGIGIPDALRSRADYACLNVAECLQASLLKNVHSDTDGAGHGLYFASRIVSSAGEIAVYSHDRLLIKSGEDTRIIEAPFWNGTIIMFRVRKNSNLDYNEIFEKTGIPIDIEEEIKRAKIKALW